MTWAVPKMWDGGECWIIGGGPSMPKQFGVPDDVIQAVFSKDLPPSAYSPYLSPIHSKHIIGVNAAYLIGDWIDIVFFGDRGWFLRNRLELAKFPGIKISCNPKLSKLTSERIKCVVKDGKQPRGINSHPDKVSWNNNSGAAAISVAANMGVKRIILLGFDMTLDDNDRQHWHGLYGTANRRTRDPKRLPFNRHLRGFPQIAKDAKRRNIEILNACPNSEIKQFKKVTVEEILRDE